MKEQILFEIVLCAFGIIGVAYMSLAVQEFVDWLEERAEKKAQEDNQL